MRVAPGTWRLAAPLFVLGVLVLLVSPIGGVLALGIGLIVVWFHRDPDRSEPDSGVLSPADGRVSVVRTEEVDGEERVRVGMFMNVTDVHVNRAPVAGTVTAVEHVPGGHWPAFTKDAARNERLHVDIGDYRVTLIAGTLARRIHPHVEEGVALSRGDRLGHVSFGSRVDVLFPERVERGDVAVTEGDRVRAGKSVIVAR
jgi:phosphatidylserine decarboxylase